MTAREAAKDLIRHYGLRGDTIKQLADGMLGSYGGKYDAQIGGYIFNNFQRENEKSIHLKRYQFGVSEIEGKEVMEVFSLREIYEEICQERDYGKQVPLDL